MYAVPLQIELAGWWGDTILTDIRRVRTGLQVSKGMSWQITPKNISPELHTVRYVYLYFIDIVVPCLFQNFCE